MDRRTLLAFVLLTLVLFLYQFLIPKKQAPQEGEQTQTAQTLAGDESPAELQPSPDSAPPSGEDGEVPTLSNQLGLRKKTGQGPAGLENILLADETVLAPLEIRNELYSAQLNPDGAAITTWRLRDYTDAREMPADLVADPQAGMIRLVLVGPDGSVDLSRTRYLMRTEREGDVTRAVLEAEDAGGARVSLAFTFPPDRYSAALEMDIQGVPNEDGDVYLELSYPEGIAFLERNDKVDAQYGAGLALLGKDLFKAGGSAGFGCGGGSGGGWTKSESGVVRWAGTKSKYFLLAVIPRSAPDGDVIMTRPDAKGPVITTLRLPLSVSGKTRYDFDLYAGPMKYPRLEKYGVGLERAVDLGWKILVPFSRLLLKFFLAVHEFVPNYGLVILILSVLTKVLFLPLTKKSMESMKAMQALKPEMDRLNAKYKDDPQKRNQAMMELYKKNKVNPAGGCLPLLIQMPVFIALYSVLNTSIELRKAPFVLWIQDLSAPDKVGEILGLPIHILPLVMAATMILQQKLTPTDPRQAAMAYLMPIVMTVFFYPMPSGLVLYWTINNVMQIGQQIWMNRSTGHAPAAA